MYFGIDPDEENDEDLHREASLEQAEWEEISSHYGQEHSPFEEDDD